jgi:deazaflavin-dependent oxidoreductase (nitroreductase family)
MPKTQPASTILDQLARSNEIHLTVTGRKTGRKSTRPVWFVFENGTLYLLPVSGSDTQWYKNVPDHPDIEVEVHKAKGTFRAVPVTDPQEVKNVVEKFRAKYGVGDVKKYYSKFDAAVLAEPA